MPEEVEQLEKSKDGFFKAKSILSTCILIWGGRGLADLGFPFPIAFAISGSIANIVDYWVPPRPKESFVQHFIPMTGIFIGLLLAAMVIPPYLIPFMPRWFAYFLPLILLSVPPYFFVKAKLPKPTFIKWVFSCITFAAIFSTIFLFIPPHR